MKPIHGYQIFLGRFYPKLRVWAYDYYNHPAKEGECTDEGFFYFKGKCFELEKRRVLYVFFETGLVVRKGQPFRDYYVLMRSEKQIDHEE
jgi:hypothetical protein